MPVEFDRYKETAAELAIDPDSNAFAILSFLARSPTLGFKPSEISAHVDIPDGSINPTLSRLEARGLVEHEPPYWSVVEDDRLAALGGTLHSMQAFEARHGDDDFSDWTDSDVDPRANR